MKKGLTLLMFSLMLISIALISGSEWCTVDSAWSPTECVCDHTPNSLLGFGQVNISPTIYSCKNIKEGVCPEDFSDPFTGIIGNCASCLDPDCTGNISGIVRDTRGNPIANVIVTIHPIAHVPGVNLEQSVTTGSNGVYSIPLAPTGTYYISASKEGYDTQLFEVTVIRNGGTIANFVLNNGTCHDDCTDSYNRCNPSCDGITFNDSSTKCQFYGSPTNDTVKNLCSNKMKGTEVFIAPYNATHGWFIECCGDIASPNPKFPYKKYYTKASVNSESIKNLITVQKIAKKDGVPVVIMINYWNTE